MGGIGQDLWQSFKAVSGPIATIAALGLAVWGGLYPPAAVIQVRVVWLVVVVLVVATVLLTAWNMVAVSRREARNRLPRTRTAFLVGDEGPDELVPVIILLDRSDLFGVNLLVAIYYNEPLAVGSPEHFERLIGVGRVANVQRDGRVQVLVLRELPAHAESWQRIRRRDADAIGRVVVKPSVPYDEAGVEVRVNG